MMPKNSCDRGPRPCNWLQYHSNRFRYSDEPLTHGEYHDAEVRLAHLTRQAYRHSRQCEAECRIGGFCNAAAAAADQLDELEAMLRLDPASALTDPDPDEDDGEAETEASEIRGAGDYDIDIAGPGDW